MGQKVILKTKDEKNLGVVIQDTLSPDRHINQLFGSTYRMLTSIETFHYMNKHMMKKILTSMVRTSEVGICSSGVVTKCKKGYKEIRKDPKSSHKNGTRTKRADI